MANLYVLMGAGKTRKSATIRALTGFTRNGNRKVVPFDVRLTNGAIIKICVFSVSPQEDNISVLKFAKKIANINQKWDILLALHPDDKAFGYIEAITETKRCDIYIAPMGMEEIPNNLQIEFDKRRLNPKIIFPGIANSGGMPANEIAARIRSEWGWL